MNTGSLILVLHAHLPYGNSPQQERTLEERWFFEAVADSYLPLIRVFDRLLDDGIPFRVTLSVSPTLAAMLADEGLQDGCMDFLDRRIELAAKEVVRTRFEPRLNALAVRYLREFEELAQIFDERYGRGLLRAFRRFQEAGAIEWIPCAATHGYLPLLKTNPGAVRAQIQTAAKSHARIAGRAPGGMWLPECGYYPGLENELKDAGIRWFLVESHGLANADVHPHYGLAAPIACPNGVAAFGRDADLSRLVWSAQSGYPGDPEYRDFYRDIGFDLEAEYVGPYILNPETRTATGIKYHRVTGDTDRKDIYDAARGLAKADEHATHFLAMCAERLHAESARIDRPPAIVVAFDAELFGHWWHEGPAFLDFVIRKLTFDQNALKLATPVDCLAEHAVLQRACPAASSWGEGGYSRTWINGENDWLVPHLHRAAGKMAALAGDFPQIPRDPLVERALRQAGRELLLAQASDWSFIMKSGTTVDTAFQRVRDCLGRFYYLEARVREGHIELQRLEALEEMNRIFPQLDWRDFLASAPAAASPADATAPRTAAP